MILPGGHLKGRLMKKFASLGPYIRENKCENAHFFFDCLAICVNTRLAPEKREFWGWWMELNAQNECFVYEYYFGLFDKKGDWQLQEIKNEEDRLRLEEMLVQFGRKLKVQLDELALDLKPAEHFNDELQLFTT
ncbi:sigma factor-binding protein Crl [Enterobacteriaceae bacterium LUAb1]